MSAASEADGLRARLMRRLHEPIYAARIAELVRCIVPHLRAGDRVLDVGCGYGTLGRAVLDSTRCPADVTVRGLERAPRPGELIEVTAYEGGRMPFDDDAFEAVVVADVLHHEEDPDALLDECARVTRRLLIVKDHRLGAVLAGPRVRFIDWAANAPYGVPCLYRYRTLAEWRASHDRLGLQVVEERTSMNLYPPGVNLLFGRRLQYLAVLRK
ncbi:MAG: class I SAM-dependent methyltransferase [Planctomycetota bacterium]